MKIHFLGIGGSGESAVAAIAEAQGFEVSGCDKDLDSEFLKPFNKEQLQFGHSAVHVHPRSVHADLLVITPAILSLDPDNEELLEAKKQSIPVLTWQEFMGKYLHKDKFVIAVAGTHGKTTTTAMIAQMLEDAGLDPTVELGAIYQKWGVNFRVGKSKYFITEADEFNDNYLNYYPDLAVVINIDFEHPEFFKDFEEYKDSFRKFVALSKKAFVNMSDKGVVEALVSDKKTKEFNFPELVDFSKSLDIDLPLKVSGDFNKSNALAAFQVGFALNLDANTIRNSLMQFSGVGRRMELVGEYRGAKIYSDFGHHPTEIKVTVEALRQKFPDKRIWIIFQPHMFSRTKALFEDFVNVLGSLPVDQISVLDIYPSREVDTGLVNSKQLVDAIKKPNVSYLGPREDVEKFLKLAIRKDDVVLFIGAGDIDKIARNLISKEKVSS